MKKVITYVHLPSLYILIIFIVLMTAISFYQQGIVNRATEKKIDSLKYKLKHTHKNH